MPYNYKEKGISRYEVPKISLWGYYSLVLSSLTGFSSLFGFTEVICAYENLQDGLSECPEVTDDIISYLNIKKESCKIIRRFEYIFQMSLLHVQMFHVQGEDKKLHLVELIYPTSWISKILLSIIGF